MADRLSPLMLLPATSGAPWTGADHRDASVRIAVDGQMSIELADQSVQSLGMPLFWYDPPWHQLPVEVASLVAGAVADHGVTVAALLSEISSADLPATFHASDPSDESVAQRHRQRMIPYRAERYGLSAQDFDDASVIEMRLATPRNADGRFAYSADQLARWEATPTDRPLAGGGWVRAATFPPDVPSLDDLGAKLEQLRMLSPEAVIMVSMYPHRLDEELPAVLDQGVDGVILNCGDACWDGLALASITRRARQWMDKLTSHHPALWIVPGEVSASDAAKLVELGASAIAVDGWCQSVIENAVHSFQQSAAVRMGYSRVGEGKEQAISALVEQWVQPQIDEFVGLVDSIFQFPPGQRLAATDPRWAKAFDLPLIDFLTQ